MTPKMISAAILLYIQLLSACVPVFCTVYSMKVKNSTRDTLIIGASRYNSIDSVRVFLDLDMVTDVIKIKNHRMQYMEAYPIPPDSIGRIPRRVLFWYEPNPKGDLFIIKLDDIRKYTWRHICKKRPYKMQAVTEEWAKSNDYLIEYKDNMRSNGLNPSS